MTMIIQDGTGTGKTTKVGFDNQLEVHASSVEQQHYYSERFGQAYQVQGFTGTLSSATLPILHIRNTSVDKEIVITYIRHQVVDQSATVPATSEYFSLRLGRTYSSGGTAVTPTNLNTGSGNEAEATCYDGTGSTLTLAGTATEIDRYYTVSEASLLVFNKEGSIIIAPNDTLECAYVGTSTAGIAYCRVSFYMEPIGAG